MAMAKKKSSTPPVIGYGTNVKRGKAVAKAVAGRVKNTVAASGGPGAVGMKKRAGERYKVNAEKMFSAKKSSSLGKKFNPDDRAMVAESKRAQANYGKRKMAKAMNKKRG